MPAERLRETITEMGHISRGYKASSEAAGSTTSKMFTLMTQMGREQRRLEKARVKELELAHMENALLKKTFGWIQESEKPGRFRRIDSVQTRCIVIGEAQKSPLFWRFSGGF